MNTLEIIVLLDNLTEERKALLESVAPGANYRFADRNTVDSETLHSADIIIGNPSPEKLAGSPKLKYLQLSTAGAERFLKEGILADDVLFCTATGTYNIPIP